MTKVGLCISEVELNDYLSGAISGKAKSEIETHLADCNTCLEKLVFAYEAVRDFNKTKKEGEKHMKPAWKRNGWLFGAILAFALSFLVHRYFVQLLVATILLGVKWIFDSVNARILIMIYNAWNKGGEHETNKILNTFKNRLP
ncbi:MAG: zf-HC2 domain-containing protein [Omnitrophica bacterium]|nr:zf-HC2 domain-containing protein [Candidatus Omnitrophota bacterium]